jgi:hypothetical protein
MKVKNAIPHPRIMGVIRECGGKMWMMERTSFLQAFLARIDSQDRGTTRRPTYSSRLGNMMNPVLLSVYRS